MCVQIWLDPYAWVPRKLRTNQSTIATSPMTVRRAFPCVYTGGISFSRDSDGGNRRGYTLAFRMRKKNGQESTTLHAPCGFSIETGCAPRKTVKRRPAKRRLPGEYRAQTNTKCESKSMGACANEYSFIISDYGARITFTERSNEIVASSHLKPKGFGDPTSVDFRCRQRVPRAIKRALCSKFRS